MPGERVLVVDDDPDVLESLGMLVAEIGYVVETAISGAEALSKMERGQFDLILTDLQMPGLNGSQVAAEIQKRRPSMPIVLISGRVMEGEPANISRFLRKPFTLDDLRTAIAASLR